jgi:drug/metabolite transporter, DME family
MGAGTGGTKSRCATGEQRREAGKRSASQGYALVALAYVIFGAIGVLVDFASAPESVLLVLRFGTATLVLAALFARPRVLAEYRRPGVARRLLAMGVLDAASMLCFFVALRQTGVATGMFLFYTGPVFVALLAPRFTRQSADRAVWAPLALSLAGLAVIVGPQVSGAGGRLSLPGLAMGVAAALLWASFMVVMNGLTETVSSGGIVLAECALDTLFLAPLAAVQMAASAYSLTGHDLFSGALLGLLCTAFAYLIFVAGLSRIRVQRAAILGYLEPTTAPFYALVLLGQRPADAALAGGALILVAGLLVVVLGAGDGGRAAASSDPECCPTTA